MVDQQVKRHHRRPFAILAGTVVALLVFALYVSTLAPTVLYYDRPLLLDSAMLQVQAIVLGIAGGTGSPSWVMLTHLFTYLPIGDPAYRTNLASAAYAAAAVLMVYITGLLLSRRVLTAAVGALAFGLSHTFWSVAVVAEVYGLNALLITLPIISLLVWQRNRRDRYLLLAVFLMGFALTNHLTSGLVLPGGVLFVLLVDWRKLVDWRLVLKGAGLFALGLLPYLYLPIRASMNPPLDEWHPTNWHRFWALVSGGTLQNEMFAFGPAQLPDRFMIYGEHLFQNYNWVLVMVGLTGAMLLMFKDRAVGLFTLFLFAGWLFYAAEYDIFDVSIYFIPTYIILALWISVGLGAVMEALEDAAGRRLGESLQRTALFTASILLMLVPFIGVWNTYKEDDMSDAYRGRDTIEAVVEKAKPNATILHHRSELWYMVLVEKKRRDLTIVDPWFPGRQRYADIVWPDDTNYVTTNLRYGTNDYTGVSTAFEAAEKGPVYILNEDSAAPQNFYAAGFQTRHVGGDLFELIPPDQVSDSKR